MSASSAPWAQEHFRRLRHDHALHAERTRQHSGVNRTSSTGGDQRKVPRVMSLLHSDQMKRVHHVRIHDLEHRLRRFEIGDAEQVRRHAW